MIGFEQWGAFGRWVGVGMIGGVATLGVIAHESVEQQIAAALPARSATVSTPPALAKPTAVRVRPKRPSLAREAALLAQSRKDLSQGNSAAALDGLDRYLREFPRGDLAPEALFLLIEVLRARGGHARALALASHFVTKNPHSPYTASMRRLMGEARAR